MKYMHRIIKLYDEIIERLGINRDDTNIIGCALILSVSDMICICITPNVKTWSCRHEILDVSVDIKNVRTGNSIVTSIIRFDKPMIIVNTEYDRSSSYANYTPITDNFNDDEQKEITNIINQLSASSKFCKRISDKTKGE